MDALLTSIGYERWAISALLIIPMVGALIVALVPERLAKTIAFTIALIEMIVSLGLWVQFDPAGPLMQFEAARPWIPGWGIAYRVGVDGISLMMVLLTTVLMPWTILASFGSIHRKERGYYALMLAMVTGMLGVFVSLDLFLFYVMWEVMLIPMYFIIGIWGGKDRLYASIKFFVYTMAGSLLMLVAILYLYFVGGRATGGGFTFSLSQIALHSTVLPWHTQLWLFIAFFLAFAIKVPVFPFHTWLPDAHTEAPTAGSVILAAVMLKMGTYGFIRFAVPLFPAVALHPTVKTVILVLAVVGILYGALVAMVQPDFKRLVAYSSVSHLGFVMLGLWAVTVQSVQGALMVMINHGLSTGALFLLIGMIYDRRHSRLIGDYGGIARVMPMFAALLTFAAFSSIAVPGTNGFIGEFLVLVGSYRTEPLAAALATIAVIFAAAYLLWALKRILYGPIVHPENESLVDLNGRELAVLAPLVALMLWLGLAPGPVLRRMEPAAEAYVERVQDITRQADMARGDGQ